MRALKLVKSTGAPFKKRKVLAKITEVKATPRTSANSIQRRRRSCETEASLEVTPAAGRETGESAMPKLYSRASAARNPLWGRVIPLVIGATQIRYFVRSSSVNAGTLGSIAG